jgi:hypothetical protein
MRKKVADQSSSPADPQSGEDLEEQGLRILARFIARKLAKSRRDEYVETQGRGEDDASAPVSTGENIS